MNLTEKVNVSALENDMQREVAEYFSSYRYNHQPGKSWKGIKAKVYREVSIPEINRRSDVIVMLSPRKVFNIECKVNDVKGVITQAKDHLKWADYSYICLHSRTYVSPFDIKEMLEHNIGLLMWAPGVVMDIFGAFATSFKEGVKRKEIRDSVLKTLKNRQ